MLIRIGGVYNSDIVSYLRGLDIKDFKFDLRPRSFNFIPLSSAREIFLNNINSDESISICFEDDSKTTIEEVTSKIKGELSFENIYLEFYSSLIDIDFLDSFKADYFLHISSSFNPKSIPLYKNLKKLIIHNKDVEQLKQFDKLNTFMEVINSNLTIDQSLELQHDWDEDVNTSFIEQFNIQHICFDISSKVELSYRNLDKDLLESLLLQKNIIRGDSYENSTN